jgi:hypothetical protein
MLPHELIEHVASFCDLDGRRALGMPPRKLVVPTGLRADLDALVTKQRAYVRQWERAESLRVRKCHNLYILTWLSLTEHCVTGGNPW